jgi:sugar/nucleoside kinase (ribokinase family)
MLDDLRSRGCQVGGVTLGERGLVWYEGKSEVRTLSALALPRGRVLDTNGAGDVFHGAYVHSFLAHPTMPWDQHFRFARAAAAFKVQHLGNEAGLPTIADIAATQHEFESLSA